MGGVQQAPASAIRRWANRHPALIGLAVFSSLFVPLALQGSINHDSSEVLLALPGGLLLGGTWYLLYRRDPSSEPVPGRRQPPGPDIASHPPPTKEDRILAQVAQLGMLVAPVVLPAVVLFTSRDRLFVRACAAQALNLQMVFAAAVAGLIATVVATDVEGATITVYFGVCQTLYAYCLVVSLLGTKRAADGIVWRYPLCPAFFH